MTSLSSANHIYDGYRLEGHSYVIFVYDLEDSEGNRRYEVNIFTSDRREIIRFDDVYYNCTDTVLRLLYDYCINLHKSMKRFENEENTRNPVYLYIKDTVDKLAFHYRSIYDHTTSQQDIGW